MNYTGKKVMIGLSGGINSMAVLCWLVESGQIPSELHLFYAHFAEHSPDTFQFVADGIRYARKHFPEVKVRITSNSVLRFFKEQNMIPHPTISPCSERLKIIPMLIYCDQNQIEIDLIGYVKQEMKRVKRMNSKGAQTLFLSKDFPIQKFSDDWCLQMCDRHIGWHPAIYDLRDENGKRLFKHNNCLPCKNMYVKDMKHINNHYPEYMTKASDLSNELKSHWGRNADDYYTQFGREDYETPQCETCQFD